MSFWMQHGYGKGDKIDLLHATGNLTGGVLLSPADEDRTALTATVQRLQALDVRALLDPQLYVHTIRGGTARCHDDHGLDFGALRWLMSPRVVDSQARACIDAAHAVGLGEVIAPTPYLATFNDVWTPVSLQYAQATLDNTDEPVFISVVAEDAAFGDWQATSDWLDAVTSLDAHGVYLVVGHSGRSYPFAWEANRLTNVLRVVYSLATINQYEVVWGYSDLAGLAGLAVGASGSATGWFHSLRMWTPQKWLPSTGGRQAKPRITPASLMAPVEAEGEAATMASTNLGATVFPDQRQRQRLLANPTQWAITDAWRQHVEAVARMANAVTQGSSDPARRLDSLEAQLSDAIDMLSRLDGLGAVVGPIHPRSLTAILDGVQGFRQAEGV